ncbi:MAG: NeuD/PglB/VioB family sugar acetyltransferase [Saprospiraceae bacterium]|jgi:sugar O-acyltransferase (sialic acid O-acetyltransferase NeuD family)|nr:NeuD/PglB/VioB family sugar acetyltransferase [Saprospiraceae bacterium]
MNNEIYIVGARLDGHAGIVIDTIRLVNKYKIAGFIDNTPELQGKIIDGIPVIGSTNNLLELNLTGKNFHIAIGDNVARWAIKVHIENMVGGFLTTIIHPSAILSNKCIINKGAFIGPGVIINNGAKLGEVCIINSGAIIEHDNIIGNAVHMAPGTVTAGRVKVNDLAFVGVGSTIMPDIEIGEAALVGAGSTVVKDVVSKETVIGYAAKKHNKNIYISLLDENNS